MMLVQFLHENSAEFAIEKAILIVDFPNKKPFKGGIL